MFTGMIARYDVTELSTALKPFFLKALCARGYEQVFYFDPDIRVTGGLEALVAELDAANVVLTPHLLAPIGFDGRQPDEIAILQAGAYNLGFIGVANRPATHAFLDWWQARLETHCLNAVASGLFVDQKWVDLVPGLFEGVRILRDPAYNVAYWNLHERHLAEANDRLEVNGRPLAFFHFSGFDPRDPQQLSQHQTRHQVAEGSVLARVLADYAAALARNDHARFAARPYGHGQFSNGAPFDAVCRAILMRSPRLLTTFTRPLDVEAEPSFFRWLNEPERGQGGPTRYMIGVYRLRPDVQAHFPDVFGVDQANFLRWFAERAVREGASAAFMAPEPAAEPVAEPVSGAALAGVNVAGYLTAELGIGEAARGYAKAVRALGLEVALLDFDATRNRRDDDTFSGFTDDNPYPVNLVCVNADQAPAFAERVGPSYMAGKYNIGVWAWELPEFPAEWADRFAMFDEIWVGSAYMAEAVSRRSPIPVVSMPYVVDVPAHPDADKARFGLPIESFVFLFSFDYLSIFERKNPLAVVEAFKRAFPDAPSARLVLKSINGETDPANRQRLRAAAADDPRIVLLEGYLSKAEKTCLLASCDCYVSLHRAEGFGLGLAEAMALGKPVMATAWSGNLEFMTPANSFLVGYEPAPLARDLGPYKQGQVWAEPDVAHAAELMREVVARPELAQSRARRAAADLRARHSPEALARRVEERLVVARAGRAGHPAPEPDQVAPAIPEAGRTKPTLAQAIAYLHRAMTVHPELVLHPEWAQRSSYGRTGVLAKTAVRALVRLVHRAGP
jgi:glycosyltransferase involved in cell wall biosynthesis